MKHIRNIAAEKIPAPLFAVFYTVGLILFFLKPTRELFLWITPFTLLGVLAVVLWYHRNWNVKTIFVFILVITLSFLVEKIGVSSGKIFGKYEYLSTLGIKIYDTPLIIGINWLLLIYGTRSIAGRYVKNRIALAVVASVFMVIYDLVLEASAPQLKMWKFESGYPPLENFLSWFGLSLIFHTLFELLGIDAHNKAARSLIVIQFIFFVVLSGFFILSST